MTKNVFKLAVVASAFATVFSANATTVQVGGIQWDTLVSSGNEIFTATANFQQWYTTGNYGTANGVETLTNTSSVGYAPSMGSYLTGVGSFSLFSEGRERSDNPSFCINGEDNCELTITFGGLEVIGVDQFDTSSAWLNIYYDDLTVGSSLDATEFGSIDSNSYSRYESAQDGMLWASLDFDDFTVAFNNGLIGLAFSSLSVRAGVANSDVEQVLDVQDGLSDISLTSQVQFSSGAYVSGSSDIRPVSAPSTLAVAGMALLLVVGLSRRKAK